MSFVEKLDKRDKGNMTNFYQEQNAKNRHIARYAVGLVKHSAHAPKQHPCKQRSDRQKQSLGPTIKPRAV